MPPPPFPPLRTRVHNTRLATGALTATPPNAGSSAAAGQAGGGSGSGKGKGKEREAESPGQLAVLRGCTIFVDVRTEEGDDAGALFVDMLRGLGAKMASRVGSRCTHVVYKNGLMSTLTRYRRLLKDPKPLVVGIAWVVECAEQRTRVDEARFLVNLELANVAGVNHKVRRRQTTSLRPASGRRRMLTGAANSVGGLRCPSSCPRRGRT
ncbi:hypothetical protein BD413DRAFT_487129 [Trametes elegans]|nr:hypothetical protein BD413DRAFT_487129 [Trametes elegans]